MALRVRVPRISLTTVAYTISADGGAFSYSGNNANLLYSRVLTSNSGNYNYSGNNANLVYTPAGAYTLTADSGGFAYSGDNANLLYNRKIVADVGTYTYSGNNATLTYVPFSGAYTLVAESGTFTYFGNNAELIYSGAQTLGGHYYAYWHKKWSEQWERKTPTIKEIIEFVEQEPEKAVEVAKTIAPKKYKKLDIENIKTSEKLAENVAHQILVAIKIQQVKMAQEEEDIETLLLIA